MATSGRGTSRVLLKLRQNVEEGNYYEAHQMYRTLYHRYMAQKKHAEAIELIYSGASLLLSHNQYTSGADLCLLLVEAFNISDTPVVTENIDKVAGLVCTIPSDVPERGKCISSALQWSKTSNKAIKTGDPELHQRLAVKLWQEKNYFEARYHFLHSCDGEGCASMLVEYHVANGYPSEVDMFVAQAVFQYLCLKNKACATLTFHMYTEKHPAISSGPPFILPLLNFLWFMLMAIEGGKLTTFTVLCEQYQPSLKRDPIYLEYLDRIGQLFFGLPPPIGPPMGGGILDNLLRGFLGGEPGNDDETDSSGPAEEELD
ncbi:Golgi to ER traffic protein 4 homolog [Acanthaster planci]|uniref:Golgi to ER traffic protein 4 homolog n=1 Tax=Acanthaster planci TaxID=133434 RepID=A0A8B7YS92_ACAPL|nr:Golgi to ER traffic protein 4 homolog [Acanthaster planci]